MTLDASSQKNLDMWLHGKIDPETRAETDKLIHSNPTALRDAFYTRLSFGTGGMRGIMGVGTNRMNRYTIQIATQGLANYLIHQKKNNENLSVAISYDSRINSRLFAEEAAQVLAGNGITAYLTQEMRPTPFVSFACRFLQCSSAIMITASHNPPEYNGYKVYWKDGGQVLPPHDTGIIEEVNRITHLSQIQKTTSLNHPSIIFLNKELDLAYLQALEKLQLYPKENRTDGKKLHVIYTSLHGTGITFIPEAMKQWGFSHLTLVEEQCIPDGTFPTVKSPNPESQEALNLGIKILENTKADILIATDPDADRVGVAVQHRGKTCLLSGNHIACLLLHHICKAQHPLPEKAAFVKNFATSELFKKIVQNYKGVCFDVPIGFKHIAEKIRSWEDDSKNFKYIFGAEESYGYLFGTYARDKDGIASSLLIAEMAFQAKKEGKTLVDCLEDLWKEHGVFIDTLASLQFPETKEGKEQMRKGIEKLRHQPPQKIGGVEVNWVEDHFAQEKTCLQDGKKEKIRPTGFEALIFWLIDGSRLIIRPSGTEPKLKIYCAVQGEFNQEKEKELKEQAKRLLEGMKTLF